MLDDIEILSVRSALVSFPVLGRVSREFAKTHYAIIIARKPIEIPLPVADVQSRTVICV